jgi:hypothetical protein
VERLRQEITGSRLVWRPCFKKQKKRKEKQKHYSVALSGGDRVKVKCM